MRLPFRLTLLSLAALALAACGFHLRVAQPLNFHTLWLSAAENEPFAVALRETLVNTAQLTMTQRSSDAEVQLQILAAGRERAILSLTTAGRVREVTLRQRVRFQVLNGAGETLLEPADLVVDRVLSFNDPSTLSKVSEEAQIYEELQADTVRLLMLRLSALKLPVKDGH
jgi:LPS-assembly lipoprotein